MTYFRKRPPLDPCPVETVTSLIAGKWKARIMLELSGSPVRFAVLRRALPGVSQQVLSTQLRELEAAGLIARLAAGNRLQDGSVYELTREGHSLVALLDQMARWGIERLKRTGQQWAPPPGAELRFLPTSPDLHPL